MMKWFDILFGVYWIGIGIAAFCGVQWNPITVGCAMLVAGIRCFSNALRNN